MFVFVFRQFTEPVVRSFDRLQRVRVCAARKRVERGKNQRAIGVRAGHTGRSERSRAAAAHAATLHLDRLSLSAAYTRNDGQCLTIPSQFWSRDGT